MRTRGFGRSLPGGAASSPLVTMKPTWPKSGKSIQTRWKRSTAIVVLPKAGSASWTSSRPMDLVPLDSEAERRAEAAGGMRLNIPPGFNQPDVGPGRETEVGRARHGRSHARSARFGAGEADLDVAILAHSGYHQPSVHPPEDGRCDPTPPHGDIGRGEGPGARAACGGLGQGRRRDLAGRDRVELGQVQRLGGAQGRDGCHKRQCRESAVRGPAPQARSILSLRHAKASGEGAAEDANRSTQFGDPPRPARNTVADMQREPGEISPD